jgi:energy-coupling factor transporter ATP-binding protein EcfA2
MRFKPDRCAHCGGPPRIFDSDYGLTLEGKMASWETFFFCSDGCFESEINRHMPADLALGKTPSEDREYKSLVEKYNDTRRRWYPAGRLYSNAELEDLRQFDEFTESTIARYQDDWINRRNAAFRHALRELSDIWFANEQQELRKQKEERALEAAEAEALIELIKSRPIPDSYRAEHTHILGPSGSGKTTLLQQMILADLAKDDPPGMVIIDPKGLMVERLQSLDVFNPDTGRLKDRLIVIDPTYDPPPALNMFHAAARWNQIWSAEQRRRIETQAISTFAFIFSSTGSPLTDKQATPFGFAVRLMFGMESNIHSLIDLMDDPTRTDDPKGQPYSQCRFAPFIGRLDATSERFFRNEFFSANYRETRQQIKARIYGVLQHPEFVRMFEARERKLDMLDCLQNKSIVLVNTGMNTLGSDASQLLGRYMISLTLNAAYARFTLPRNEWHQAHLIIDEFQEFADEEKTPELLRLAREYNLAVTMAHQEMHGSGMTEKIRSAVSTNTTIKYASSPEGVDLSYVARDLRCEPSFLTAQSKTSTEARFACFVRGFTQHPFVHAAPFGEIDRQPQMSREALGRMLRANAERLSLQELPSKPLPQAFQPSQTPLSSEPERAPATPPVRKAKPPPAEDDNTVVSTDW